jgi:ankyrin repeat protein
VKLLLETGQMDLQQVDKMGKTPLSYAMEDGHAEIVDLLREAEGISTAIRAPEMP